MKNKTTKNSFSDPIKSKNFKAKIFCKLPNMHMYCKNCKKHTRDTFPKKLVLISKNKINGK